MYFSSASNCELYIVSIGFFGSVFRHVAENWALKTMATFFWKKNRIGMQNITQRWQDWVECQESLEYNETESSRKGEKSIETKEEIIENKLHPFLILSTLYVILTDYFHDKHRITIYCGLPRAALVYNCCPRAL